MARSLLVTAVLSTLAWPAFAQDCQPIAEMKAWLEGKHQEFQVSGGISLMDRKLVMVFAKADGSSFTIIRVSPSGMACIAEIGEDWQVRVPEPDLGEGL